MRLCSSIGLIIGVLSSFNVVADSFECNLPVASFLNSLEKESILMIPKEIENKLVKKIQALIYFRESHGGYRSCFGLQDRITKEKIKLFCEEKWSDNPMIFRGDNDWLGTVEGGILGEQSAAQIVTLLPEIPYQMIIWGEFPPHEIIAKDVKTNFNDPITDLDSSKFTFFEESKLNKVKYLTFIHSQPQLSTILGFEDEYSPEAPSNEYDYNDIIIEMCLLVDY